MVFLRHDEEITMKNKQELRGSRLMKGKKLEKVWDLLEVDGIL